MPWHEKLLITAVCFAGVIYGLWWLFDQFAKGMDG